MYTVTITNSTAFPMTTGDGTTIEPGGTWQSGELGNTYVHSDQFGAQPPGHRRPARRRGQLGDPGAC